MDTLLATGFGPTFLPKRYRTPFAGSCPVVGALAAVAAAVLLLAVSTDALAQSQDAAVAVAAAPAAANVELMNSLLGRIAPAALVATAPRVTVEHERLRDDQRATLGQNGLDAYGRPLVELGGVTYRWWVNHGAANFGVGLGTVGYLSNGPEAGQAQQFSPDASVLTLGWRLQVGDQSTVFADASGARRFNTGLVDRYSTKVGLEWKGRTNKFGIDGASRSLALQLDSGYKMSVRVRRNGVGVVLKGQF